MCQEMVKHFVGDIDLEMRGSRDTLEASKLHDSSPLNVRGEIDLVRQLRDVHLKPLLHLIQGLSVRLVADEGDGQTLGTKPASPSNSVQVSVSVLWHVVVEDDVDALDIHATAKQVGGNQDSLLEVLELLVPGQPLLLAHPPVDGDGGEVLLNQQLSQGHAALHRLDEDDHLVELQHIKKLKQLPVLLRVLQLDVVLPQPVQGELCLVVDVHLHRVLHELLADWSDVLGEGGAEHHHLLLVGSRTENLLHVTPHVQLLEHLVALIQDEVLQVLQWKLLGTDQSQNPM